MHDASLQPAAVRAVIFDMDGTLTRSTLDFDAIRADIGLAAGPILEAMRDMAPDDRARAEEILHRHESSDAASSVLQPYAADVVAALRARGIRVALMTRNSAASLDTFLARHGIAFDLTRTREDGPCKPSPEPVLDICRRLRVSPSQTWVVGDFHFDILCGRAAGCRTILFLEPGATRHPWADEADVVIHDLREILAQLDPSSLSPSAASDGCAQARTALPLVDRAHRIRE